MLLSPGTRRCRRYAVSRAGRVPKSRTENLFLCASSFIHKKKKKNYNTHASGGGISPTRTSRVRTSKRTRRRRIFPFIKTRVRRGNRIEDRRVRVDKKNKFERVVCVSETVVHPVVLFLKLFFHPRHVEPLLSSNRRCRPP